MGQKLSCFDVVAKVAPKNNEFADRGAAVVTGATSGIGIPTTESLLLAGFDKVFVTARNEKAADALVTDLKAKYGDVLVAKLTVVSCDLTDLASVKTAALQIDRESGADGVSVLINNAGIMAVPYGATTDNLEKQIGTNHFGHTLFTDLLLPALKRSGAKTTAKNAADVARVVFVASEGHKLAFAGEGFDPALWEFDERKSGQYNAWKFYGQSKLCNVLAALDYDEHFKADNAAVAAFSLHPGVINTNLGRDVTGYGFFGVISKPFLKTIPQGAATQVYCALATDALQHRGGYFLDGHFEGANAKGRDVAAAAKLMTETRKLLERKVSDFEMKDAKK